ncbi:DUF1992 domain-containing protein [Nocardioides humilatus]|uniref:DUF1992 domain-containing protein n=1 Tax=Nocardioides humilatus TaxID=2607660 RepID=A0A5B1LMC3_9ACTN|nr:DUF1992 domain-containing protein [Nocardioides humilatus]KAA1421626.1 DUF1992 domain-containing protein [Nocardioides humilatus]
MTDHDHTDRAPAGQGRAAERAAARARIEQQQTWVDLQVQRAIERGDFDDLPGAGKPIEGLGDTHDPEWWVKKLIEREQITVLPPSLQLRKEDAELDARLDKLGSEEEVRGAVEDFNARVIHARYSTPSGPPLITMPRDVEETVAAWAARRAVRRAARPAAAVPPPRRWWQRRSR